MNEIENLAMLTIREKENKDVIYGIYLLVNVISSFLITGIIFYFFLRNIEFSAQLILSVGFFFMIYIVLIATMIFLLPLISSLYFKNDEEYQYAKKIIKNYGKGSLKDISNPNEVHEAQLLALDVTKAKFRLNWKPKWNIDKTIEKTVEWYKRYNNEDVYKLCVEQIRNFIETF